MIEVTTQIIAALMVVGGIVWIFSLIAIADDFLDYVGGVYHYVIMYVALGLMCCYISESLSQVFQQETIYKGVTQFVQWPWLSLSPLLQT